MPKPNTSKGFFTFERGGRWVLRYRIAPGKWQDHRIPPTSKGGPAIPATRANDPTATEEEKRIAFESAQRVADDYAARWARNFRRHLGLAEPRAQSERSAPRERDEAKAKGTTVRALGDAWVKDKLLAKHGRVNGLRPLAGAKQNGYRLARLYALRTRGESGPLFGELDVADVTKQDIASLMAQLPKLAESRRARKTEDGKREGPAARAGTIEKYYVTLHRLFDLAEFPCELRASESNPVDRRFRPDRDTGKIFSYLYPAELLALLRVSPERLPLARKVFYVLGTYVGLRKSSILALRWRDLDLENGTLTALVVKNGEPQTVPLGFPSLGAMLTAWFERCGKPGGDKPVIGDLGCRVDREAETLRADLRAAGVSREVLFVEDDARIEPLRFHDLRATFVTWAKRAGKTEGWITDRTGHLDPKMVSRYTRAARTLADLQIEPFPELAGTIPELPFEAPPGARLGAGLVAPLVAPRRGRRLLRPRSSGKLQPSPEVCLVGHEGLEPSANGLRVHCSTN